MYSPTDEDSASFLFFLKAWKWRCSVHSPDCAVRFFVRTCFFLVSWWDTIKGKGKWWVFFPLSYLMYRCVSAFCISSYRVLQAACLAVTQMTSLQATILFFPIYLMFPPRSIPLLPLFLFLPFIIYFFSTAVATTRSHQASCQLGLRWSAYHLTAILAAAINITDAYTGFPVASVLILWYTSGVLPVASTVLLCKGFVPCVLREMLNVLRSALVTVCKRMS